MNKNKGRTLVVGDIHAGFKALLQILERSNFDNSKDKIIFLGDYVDGWSETAELIEYLIHLQKASDGRHIFLRGNHDAWAAEWLEYGRANPNWLPQGGQATVESYIRTGFVVSEEHRNFFRTLHNYYVDEQNRVFVHGGFTSHRGVGHEHYVSDYYWDRTLWEMALVSHSSKDKVENKKFFNNHKEVYLGHTTTGNWKMKAHYPEHKYPEQASSGKITVPMNRCNVWNMDTGGGFEGKLTMMDIDTKEFWQSDFVKDLYPNDRGRN